MDDRLKERLQKLKNLAERGVGGEKTTAEKKLAQLLKANGLSEQDLADDTEELYMFSYTYPYRQKLLGQIIYKVLGASKQIAYYRTKGTRNKLGVYCTPIQKLEIELDFEFYSKLLDEEISILTSAFIAKQDLYPSDEVGEIINFNDLSPEEVDQYMKRQAFANQIDKRTRSMMIEEHRRS